MLELPKKSPRTAAYEEYRISLSVGTVLGRNICAAMRRKRQGMTCRKS